MLDDIGLPGVGIPGPGGVLGDGPADADRSGIDVGSVGGAELPDSAAVGLAVEGADARVGERHRFQDRGQPDLLGACQGLVDGQVAMRDLLDERPLTCAAQCGAEPRQLGQLGQRLGIGDQGLQASCKLGDRQIGQVSGPSRCDQRLYLGGELPQSALGAGQVGRKPGAAAVDGCMAPRGGLVGGGSGGSMQSRWLRLGCLPQGQRSFAGAVAAVADACRESAEEAPGSRRERASQLVEGNSKDGGIEDGQGGRDTVEKAERLHPGTHGLREAQAAVCDDLAEADGRLGQRVVGQGVSGVEGCLGSVGCGDRPGSKGPGPGRRCLGDGKAAQADEVFQLGLGLAERLIVRGRRAYLLEVAARTSPQPGFPAAGTGLHRR